MFYKISINVTQYVIQSIMTNLTRGMCLSHSLIHFSEASVQIFGLQNICSTLLVQKILDKLQLEWNMSIPLFKLKHSRTIHLLVSPTCLIIGIEKKIHNCNITIHAKFIFNNRAICLVILFSYKNFTIYNCQIIYCYFNMTQN